MYPLKGVKAMTAIPSESKEETIRIEKENAYRRLFAFIYDGVKDGLKEKYEKELRFSLKQKDISPDETDMSFPPAAFRKDVEEVYEIRKKELEDMFSAGECLTFDIFPSYKESYNSTDYAAAVYARSTRLEKGKRLVSPVARLPLPNYAGIALFSNGKLLVLKHTNPVLIRQFQELARANGYPAGTPETTDFATLDRINAYARLLYKDRLVEENLPDKETFVTELYKNSAVCLSASEEVIVNPPLRKCFALFSNGRFIVSQNCRTNKPLKTKISDFIRGISKSFVVLNQEEVPQSYIEAVYEKAAEFSWYLDEEKTEKKWYESVREAERKKPGMTPREQDEMPFFIDELLKGGKCLTMTDWDYNVRTDRNIFALFENGRFIVNKDMAYSVLPIEFEYIAQKKRPDMIIQKELVPAGYLPAIYERLMQTQETCRNIYLNILKKKAKRLSRTENIPHHDALETTARLNGFQSWKEACKITEEAAQDNITKDRRRREYFELMETEASSLKNRDGFSIEEAREVTAKKHGFDSWIRMECSCLEILTGRI